MSKIKEGTIKPFSPNLIAYIFFLSTLFDMARGLGQKFSEKPN